jgi:hypothetical protein
MQSMYYIGLDVPKRTSSYCVKDGSGTIHAEGMIPARRFRRTLCSARRYQSNATNIRRQR